MYLLKYIIAERINEGGLRKLLDAEQEEISASSDEEAISISRQRRLEIIASTEEPNVATEFFLSFEVRSRVVAGYEELK